MKFTPRVITPAMAAEGYNNEGRGKLIGYVSDRAQHEETCPHRLSQNAYCKCRIGLWQGKPRIRVKAISVRV